MRHKSNELANLLIPDQQQFSFKPRFSKHKNFYTKQPIFDLHYITPTQQYAKIILNKICHIDKKAIVNDRSESSYQKRKHFSVDVGFTSRQSIQKKQIRIKPIQQPNLSADLQISDKDWLAFILD
ncbi:unnamed protein product [Paramecium primaurelia]|uniref:Uncharacterized protein n=1 Tax=Paramecium primaurelia TaxID=5886 RepID=A0A8S1L652_PARPR|nr:unnamed protein product [Paramecium primaurelia]